MNLLPILAQSPIGWSPTALIIAVVIGLLLILLLRFFIKTAFTLVKIAIILLIVAGAYLGFQALFS